MSEFDSTGTSSGDSGPFQPSATPVSTPSSDSTQQVDTSSNITDLSDDHLVRIPGQSEPVKYGELSKRLQADYTRKTQEASRLKQQYEREKAAWGTQKAQEEQNLRSIAASLLAKQNQGSTPAVNDPFAGLDKLQSLDGPTAAKLFNHIRENGFSVIAKAIGERDQVIQQMHNQMLEMNKTMTALQGKSSGSDFNSYISKTLTDSGLPPQAAEWAKEVYLAYEGPDLAQEFPEILSKRWNQLQGIYASSQKAKVDAARSQRSFFPGKGGQGSPSRGASLLKGNETAKDTADKLWDALQAGGDNT